ncbi:hypothetical protein, partial [Corynebacterium yonathiae]
VRRIKHQSTPTQAATLNIPKKCPHPQMSLKPLYALRQCRKSGSASKDKAGRQCSSTLYNSFLTSQQTD